MKKFLLKSLLAVSVFTSVGASAGEAVIPNWSLYASGNTCFSVSNISNTPMNVKVTLFD